MELRAEVYTRKQLSEALENSNFTYIYTPYLLADSSILKYSDRIILVPPVCLADCEEKVTAKFSELKNMGFKNALVHTIGNIEQLQNIGFELFGGHRLNCLNSDSIAFFSENNVHDIIVSTEITAFQMNCLKKSTKIGFIAYGYLPLMITRRCPIKDGKPCNKTCCGKTITDRMNNELHVICNENTAAILNSDVLYLADKMEHFNSADFAVLKFTIENSINDVAENYLSKASPNMKKFTRGLYFKGVKN